MIGFTNIKLTFFEIFIIFASIAPFYNIITSNFNVVVSRENVKFNDSTLLPYKSSIIGNNTRNIIKPKRKGLNKRKRTNSKPSIPINSNKSSNFNIRIQLKKPEKTLSNNILSSLFSFIKIIRIPLSYIKSIIPSPISLFSITSSASNSSQTAQKYFFFSPIFVNSQLHSISCLLIYKISCMLLTPNYFISTFSNENEKNIFHEFRATPNNIRNYSTKISNLSSFIATLYYAVHPKRVENIRNRGVSANFSFFFFLFGIFFYFLVQKTKPPLDTDIRSFSSVVRRYHLAPMVCFGISVGLVSMGTNSILLTLSSLLPIILFFSCKKRIRKRKELKLSRVRQFLMSLIYYFHDIALMIIISIIVFLELENYTKICVSSEMSITNGFLKKTKGIDEIENCVINCASNLIWVMSNNVFKDQIFPNLSSRVIDQEKNKNTIFVFLIGLFFKYGKSFRQTSSYFISTLIEDQKFMYFVDFFGFERSNALDIYNHPFECMLSLLILVLLLLSGLQVFRVFKNLSIYVYYFMRNSKVYWYIIIMYSLLSIPAAISSNYNTNTSTAQLSQYGNNFRQNSIPSRVFDNQNNNSSISMAHSMKAVVGKVLSSFFRPTLTLFIPTNLTQSPPSDFHLSAKFPLGKFVHNSNMVLSKGLDFETNSNYFSSCFPSCFLSIILAIHIADAYSLSVVSEDIKKYPQKINPTTNISIFKYDIISDQTQSEIEKNIDSSPRLNLAQNPLIYCPPPFHNSNLIIFKVLLAAVIFLGVKTFLMQNS